MSKRRKRRLPVHAQTGKVAHCCYCKRQLTPRGEGFSTSFTLDHVNPKARGGHTRVPCCLACNQLKGDMLPDEWDAWRALRPEWWRIWSPGRPWAGRLS